MKRLFNSSGKNDTYKRLIIIALGLIGSGFFSFSQNTVDCITPQKIQERRKYKFIHNKYLDNISNLDSLYPECYQTNMAEKFYFQEDTFIIKENINTVWQKYKSISLKDAYNGKVVDLGFVYSKNKKKVYYVNDDYEGMNEGQVYFIRLNLLGGLKHIIVAYEVTKIDDSKKMIRFCYEKNGISRGSQSIYLHQTKNGFTKVEHKTYYKSDSKLRDKWIYPKFHRIIVAELHHNLMKALNIEQVF